MTKQMNNITKASIELFLMVMWWKCLWSSWKEDMVQLMLTILHFMVIISSSILYLYIPFKQTWVFMNKLFHLQNWMWRNLVLPNQYKLPSLCLKKKAHEHICFRTILNVNINVIWHDLKDIVPLCLRYISQSNCNILSPLHIPMREHDIIMDGNNQIDGI